ncbi:PAAR-like domain-containing protein [Vibrio parahaemolyticus]|uniref:PAAR-like domain-containing protein n=1 Tax=Vibrio parahaemolyticus TaxID=670 RepID=UPI00355BBD0E
MGVTVGANGLSIVHKGSGGEANATLPDVCLTKVGKPIVPIPYGNNAKSADLAGGTTTISMDGGNSVAIKGSTFSKSTGDAGGDKKGVASGTIEAEAKFISASPTVKFEGKGVCRLSDQMTMNKANTMCLGGAQNPSVSVTEDQEGTYTVVVKVTYDDGEGFQAPYKLTDALGSVFEGILDTKGSATISGISKGIFEIEYGEDIRDFKPDEKYINENPFYKNSFDPHLLIEQTKIGEVGFWEATRNQASTVRGWLWGVIVGDFNKDPTTGQIMLNTMLGVIPGIDQVLDARDITTNILFLTEEENQNNADAWLDLALSGIGAVPTIGSVMKGVGKAVKHDKSRDDLFAMLREYGKGDVEKFILNLDWNAIKFEVLQIISETIFSFTEVLDELAKKASLFGYNEYATEIINFKVQVETVEKQAQQHIPDALMFLKDKVDLSLKRGKNKSNAGSHSSKGSAESPQHDEKVSQDKKNKKPDECWLCDKKVGKKKQGDSAANYCKEKGFKGKYYKKSDSEFGFVKRGTKKNKHYPWVFLKEHNGRLSSSPYIHPLYARCYDLAPDGRAYKRPQHLWDKGEAKRQFIQAQLAGVIDQGQKFSVGSILAAHHIITVDEMKNNALLYKKLPALGYELNDWHNIVVLPTIPELACFYELPLHSGPHPSPYTINVKTQLKLVSDAIHASYYCDKAAAKDICDELIDISNDIYEDIITFSRNGALNDKFHDTYDSGGKGCCNQLTHASITAQSETCIHRLNSRKNIELHHDFRVTRNGKLKRITYKGKVASKLGV